MRPTNSWAHLLRGKSYMKIVIVLPAYNCAKTLKRVIEEIPHNIISDIVLGDDHSSDETLEVARKCGIKHIIQHDKNQGYGANQKTCYDKALELQADVVIMLHPDYQYNPSLITPIIEQIHNGADIVFASRMMKGGEAMKNGMPAYKYYSNRLLSIFQNLCLKTNLSEYHTGYRAFKRKILLSIDYHSFSNDFIFDNQMIIEIIKRGYKIREIYCPAKYEKSSSSINFQRSVKYGLQVLYYTIKYLLSDK